MPEPELLNTPAHAATPRGSSPACPCCAPRLPYILVQPESRQRAARAIAQHHEESEAQAPLEEITLI